MSRDAAARARPAPRARAQDHGELARFFHGLADPTRVKILRFLLDGPKTAGEVVRHIGRHQPSVSSHLTCLRFCGYVEARREGRNVWYEIIDPRVRGLMATGERYLAENAERILACRVISSERRG